MYLILANLLLYSCNAQINETKKEDNISGYESEQEKNNHLEKKNLIGNSEDFEAQLRFGEDNARKQKEIWIKERATNINDISTCFLVNCKIDGINGLSNTNEIQNLKSVREFDVCIDFAIGNATDTEIKGFEGFFLVYNPFNELIAKILFNSFEYPNFISKNVNLDVSERGNLYTIPSAPKYCFISDNRDFIKYPYNELRTEFKAEKIVFINGRILKNN